MTITPGGGFPHLGAFEARLAGALGRPHLATWAALGALVLLAWAYLALAATAVGLGGTFGALGPGMATFDRLIGDFAHQDRLFAAISGNAWLSALIAVCAVSPADWSIADLVLHASMWLAMGVAMMLPTAAPMIRTYAEIADTAAGQGRRVVSPLVLAAGYLTIWSAFAVAATGLEWAIGLAGLVEAPMAALPGWLAVAVMAGAGAYQFTAIKTACLVRCARPFPVLFANWTEDPAGVFRLGIRQGIHCLGCCWALMLVMFAVGMMNIVWIAGLAVVMAAEKVVATRWFSGLVGVVLLGWAAAAALALATA